MNLPKKQFSILYKTIVFHNKHSNKIIFYKIHSLVWNLQQSLKLLKSAAQHSRKTKGASMKYRHKFSILWWQYREEVYVELKFYRNWSKTICHLHFIWDVMADLNLVFTNVMCRQTLILSWRFINHCVVGNIHQTQSYSFFKVDLHKIGLKIFQCNKSVLEMP